MNKTYPKRLISLVTAFMMMLTLSVMLPEGALTARADYFNDDYKDKWIYTTNGDGTLCITGFIDNGDNTAHIPAKMYGKTVTQLGNAFDGNKSIKYIYMADTITELTTEGTFNECTALREVYLSPNIVTLSRSNTFRKCSSLTKVGFNTNSISKAPKLTNIPDSMFIDCTSLKGFTIPNSVTSIGKQAFRGCTSLEKLAIPEGVSYLPISLVYGCTSLEYVYVPSTAKTIEDSALFIGASTYVPQIYSFSSSEPKAYANAKGIAYTSVISGISGLTCDISITGGTIRYYTSSTDYTEAKSFTDIPRKSNMFVIVTDESSIPAGKALDHWEMETQYKSITKTYTNYPCVEYNELPKNTKTINTTETGLATKIFIEDIIENLNNPGFATFKTVTTITPVYTDALYSVNATDCTADKTTATAGESVTFTADAAPEGYELTSWKTTAGTFSKKTDTYAILTMPASNVTVTAVFTPKAVYSITVKDGTADKTTAKEGESVKVEAQAPAGYTFSYWSSQQAVKFKNNKDQKTYFTMPKENVTVTAVMEQGVLHKAEDIKIYDNLNTIENTSYADVTVSKGRVGEKGIIKITLKEGPHSIRDVDVKNESGNSLDVTKVNDTTYTFIYPDEDVTVWIPLNFMKIQGTDSFRLNADGSPDKLNYDMVLNLQAYIEYLKSLDKASYTASGDIWTVDIDGDGKNDFKLDCKAYTVSKLDTTNLPSDFEYKADDKATAYLTDYLAARDCWNMYYEVSIRTQYKVNAINGGTALIDLRSGKLAIDGVSLGEYLFYEALIMLAQGGVIGSEFNEDEQNMFFDIDNDKKYDLRMTSVGVIFVVKPIGDSYTITLNENQAKIFKAKIEEAGIKEYNTYYDSFRLLFKGDDKMPGDVNNDGEVNIKDVTLLKQYLAKWNVKINETNADVTGDGVINVKDLTLLKQYIAKWNVTLK